MIIYLVTCDKTSYILPATIFLYKKFYKNTPLIRILGFKKPILPDWENVEFISLDPKQETIQKWSKYIYDYLITIKDELIFFALDDFFPIDYIDERCLSYVVNYMKENKVGFCNASQEPSSCIKRNEVDKILIDKDFFVYKRKKDVNYQLVLQPGIWNRKYLLEALSINLTPWEFELNRSSWANKHIYFNIATSNFPNNNYSCLMCYSAQSSLSSKWNGYISVLGLKHELVEIMIKNKLLDKEKLIIGAWQNFVYWNKDFTNNDLLLLSKKANYSTSWYNLYNKYYK
jgi:hypothetical protein|tara:strand:+ start:2997 stop:3857 length:861 start_codon:yes stop_codon:yes gene_type:complete